MKILMPPKEKIIKTSDDDSGPERYCSNSPLVRKIYIGRLQYALDFISKNQFNNLLEIGYGNGMLYPTLSKATKKYMGIDIHDSIDKIKKFYGPYFKKADVYKMPFKKNEFDGVICLSVLEHLSNLNKVLNEIDRVTTEDAKIIFGVPSDNLFVKLWFWIKKSPALETHINSKNKLISLFSKHYKVERKKTLRVFGIDLYTTLLCIKR